MNKYLLLIILSGLLFSCKNKKVSPGDNEEEMSATDFIGFFQPLKLPYQVTDTLLQRKETEASAIRTKIFTGFVPDSVLNKFFGKESRPRLYAIGKVKVPRNETYLFVKAATPARKLLYILSFDKKNKFTAAKPLLIQGIDPGTKGFAGMDAKYTLSITRQRRAEGGQVFYKKDAYVYNDAGVFTLIMTESNETTTKNIPVYNPIDTLSHKHKFTGDYLQDRRNFISVRDGKDPSRILFFVHFEKDDGQCKGELKGEARFISATTARYKSGGDPCTVEFSFSNTAVSMKEVEGCGNHRDIKCFFEGEYIRRKDIKAKPAKKKHS